MARNAGIADFAITNYAAVHTGPPPGGSTPICGHFKEPDNAQKEVYINAKKIQPGPKWRQVNEGRINDVFRLLL
ncbi:hypothetical protein NTGM5_300021 [Candidatus Nitrotoga sp. M5]|nr:hypothetical protein NTGM5_300021 [Candidatus Nitrotoga sp. M5]